MRVAAARLIAHLCAAAERMGVGASSRGRGVLVCGPPGCGKSALAAAVARESGWHYAMLSASALFDKGTLLRCTERSSFCFALFSCWVSDALFLFIDEGQTERRLYRLVDTALQHAPAMLVLDDIDAIAADRTSLHGGASICLSLSSVIAVCCFFSGCG